ncbi:MAG: alpha/beta fold hydrolase [Leptospiraceae bacterium]|nr:alpha/beta fold hydrolase [Leptospiraceae bacterium]MCP5510382.1 alpha/beta fold hydrolase [Leptospiraceae bacterium]
MIFDEPHPRFLFRYSFIQTFFASYKFKKLFEYPIFSKSKEVVLEESGIRLKSYLTEPYNPPRGLLVLIHGWEGSADSAYILKTGEYFYQKGFSILRVNLRDHGDTHSWNEGLFHGARLDDLKMAMKKIFKLIPSLPVYLVGFSLGGNYVLRYANSYSSQKSRLKKVIAISPAIDPYRSTEKMDQNPFLRKYFLKAWSESLIKKQKAFPEIYEFGSHLKSKTVMELTEAVVPKYSPFINAREYFQSYTFSGDTFKNLKIDSYILCAHDDPVIDTSDFYKISFHKNLKIFLTNHGGHNGFFQTDFFCPWYLPWMEEIFML